MSKILLAGEQVNNFGFEVKGFDMFSVSSYTEDGQELYDALEGGGHEATWMRTSHGAVHFPESPDVPKKYDAIVLSDVGANSLLFHPEMPNKSQRRPNRLKLPRDYVCGGGGPISAGDRSHGYSGVVLRCSGIT